MTTFSANLGFLWQDLGLPDAIRAAARAGFVAVELHWPYDTPTEGIRAALDETGLPLLGLNTLRGIPGENGLSALPGREAEAKAAIDEAIAYADAVGAEAIHVMAGFAQGEAAYATFIDNLNYACSQTERVILIEPLNRHDSPNYFLGTTDLAQEIIADVAAPNLRLMFDCYHVARNEGDVLTRLGALLPILGHIQVASVPDRGPPDHGELHYPTVFEELSRLGWERPLGAEYKPTKPTEQTLAWLDAYSSQRPV